MNYSHNNRNYVLRSLISPPIPNIHTYHIHIVIITIPNTYTPPPPPSKVCYISRTYFILKHSHVMNNNGRFSFFYLHYFILFIVILYPLPTALIYLDITSILQSTWVRINAVLVMCFHECYNYKLDLEVTLTLCDFIPMFHLKKNIQFMTYGIQYDNTDCIIMHIDMYMHAYRNKKILNDLNATLSGVHYEKASFVTVTLFVMGVPHPWILWYHCIFIRFIINIIRRYIFVCFISYMYMDMFHGECCTILLITKNDLIRKSLIHVFVNESDKVVTRATTCMITLGLGCLAASNCQPGHHGVSAISNSLHGPGCC